MKAVRIHGWNEPPSIEDIAAPVRSAGHTLVRMAAATVGHIDRTVWGGRFLRRPPLPYVPGVEAAGVVIESDRFQAGQRVWLRGAGLGTLADGTWRECIAAPDEALGLLPDKVPMPLGSAFFSPCTSAWVALHEIAKLRPGEHVLVTGASGAVGSLVLQLALELGAKATAVVSHAAAAAMLPDGVAAVLFDGDAGVLSGLGADALIDTVGGAVLAAALPAVVPGGRAVLIGYTAGNELRLDLANFMLRDVSLLPLNMIRRDAVGRAMAPALLERLGDGRLQLGIRSFALSDAAAALDWIAQRGHRGRAVLVPDAS